VCFAGQEGAIVVTDINQSEADVLAIEGAGIRYV